jgi:adenylate cyclase
MPLADDLSSDVESVLNEKWEIRTGTTVPETEGIALSGGGVELEAAMLYSDLADSTQIAIHNQRTAARLFKAFLKCGARIIRASGGYVRSFDGDRVMGVFIGDSKNSNAAKCALQINYTFLQVIKPKFQSRYEIFRNGLFNLAHCTGVDRSNVLAVRAGIRNNNDLVWVGRAANVAAKLSGIRGTDRFTYITEDVYNRLNEPSKLSKGVDMWEKRINSTSGVSTIYCSNYWWQP